MGMRHKTYAVRLANEEKEVLRQFEPIHFKEAGLAPTPEFGMTELEALHLINKWNRTQLEQKYVYYLTGEDIK